MEFLQFLQVTRVVSKDFGQDYQFYFNLSPFFSYCSEKFTGFFFFFFLFFFLSPLNGFFFFVFNNHNNRGKL